MRGSAGPYGEPSDDLPLRTRLLEGIIQDLRFALRSLRGDRTFTIVAALTIAVGVGATTAVLSIADAILFRPPPIPQADRLGSIWELRRGSVAESMEGRLLPYERYVSYVDATDDVFAGLAAHRYAHFSMGVNDGASAVDGFLTSGNYFQVLGLTPTLGRFYSGDEENAVVLSHRIWRARFGAEPAVIGQVVSIDSRTFTVVGVAPPVFGGTMAAFTGDVWIPVTAYARLNPDGPAGDVPWVVPVGRFANGISETQVHARIDAAARLIPPEQPHVEVEGARLDRITWRGDFVGVLRTGLAALGAAAALLLLIASANIAGMMVARSFGRHREITVRLALGAGRSRVIRQLLTESLVLFSIGGLGGVLLAVWGTRALSAMAFPINATVAIDAAPDLQLLLAALGGAALTGLLFGMLPAMRASRVDLTTSLKAFGRTPRRSMLQNTFVAGQLAISTLLLVTAGLFARSFARLADVDLGFEPRQVLVATINLDPHGYDVERGRAFFDALVERVAALSGVQSAALARYIPLGGSAATRDVTLAGADESLAISAHYNAVDTAFFSAMQVPLAAGRGFTGADDEGSQPVAILDERLAQRLWPGQSAIGRFLLTDGVEHEVVGVVRDGAYAFVYEAPRGLVYHPFAQDWHAAMSLHVRSTLPAGELTQSIRRITGELDPNVALEAARPMTDVVSFNTFPQRFATGLTGLFAITGLLLAALGVYGLLAAHVAQRYREFGIRMAIGARSADVLQLVLGQGARLALIGCLIGLSLAVAAGRFIASLLFGISPFDRLTFGSVPVILLAVALLASMMPALRATRSDLVETLRQE